jgi:serine/threonine protein kinase
MGSCLSGFAPPHLLDVVDGNEDDYQQRYLEEKVLGEGEFGVVKLVHDMHLKKKYMQQEQTNRNDEPTPFACKILQKGVVFKDNVLYTPLKPEVLRGEIHMLRTLAGECYCVQLRAVYESTKRLYVITECCMGGTMTQYVAASSGTSFTTHDVSRIAYQLLLAVHHCAKYRILHRDIKPDNIMFTHPRPGADIRLIDFGSGCMDSTTTDETATSPSSNSNNMNGSHPSSKKKMEREYVDGLRVHTTFAGSAFYISPELYNRSYTAMTDVWSVGVTLYVLVAGYPADALQKAFNILQTDQRDLHNLPNIPNNGILPESFFTLLDSCLTYWYQKRPKAQQLLQYEFVKLHQQHKLEKQHDNIDDPIASTTATEQEETKGYDDAVVVPTIDITTSNKKTRQQHSLRGSVLRHNIFLNFQQYERSLTALLATLLSKSELEQLVFVLNKRVMVRIGNTDESIPDQLPRPSLTQLESSGIKEQQQLAVVPISELKSILCDDLLKEGMYVSSFTLVRRLCLSFCSLTRLYHSWLPP